MSKKLVNFMAEEYDHEYWKDQARAYGISFSEWVRRKLNDGPISPRVPLKAIVPDDEDAPFHSRVNVVITGDKPCSHRLPRGTFCKKCRMIRR